MKYKIYYLLLDRMTKTFRKNSKKLGITISKGAKGISDLIPNISVYAAPLVQTLDWQIMGEELYWLENGKIAYYPERKELIDLWVRSTLKTEDPSLLLDDEVFTLALPKDCNNDFINEIAGGLLVASFDKKRKRAVILEDFNNRSGFGHMGIKESGGMMQGTKTLSITYNLKSDSPHMQSRVVVNDVFLSRYMEDPTYANYERVLKEFQDFDHLGLIEVKDDREKRIQWSAVTLVMGFILYKKALSERIVDGLPVGLFKSDVETVIVNNRSHKTIKYPEVSSGGIGENKNYHLRMGHYRQLKDPKFYRRDEYKNMKVGSRIVSVAPAVVGREINNKTAK